MNNTINLANPDFEPSDEQLRELSHRAFAHVRQENENGLRQLEQRIAKARAALYQQITKPAEKTL